MITFYYKDDCKACDAVEEIMDKLVLAHESKVVHDKNELPQEARTEDLPVMDDDGQVFSGLENIVDHLADVAGFKHYWDQTQSKNCYCEPEPANPGDDL
jgi:hypothetical protein